MASRPASASDDSWYARWSVLTISTDSATGRRTAWRSSRNGSAMRRVGGSRGLLPGARGENPPPERRTRTGAEKVAPPASVRGFPAVAEDKVWELQQPVGEHAAPARRR